MMNSRLPQSIRGDFYAQVAACRTGEQRLQAILDRFGRTTVDAARRPRSSPQCERLDREVIAALPDGTWEAEGYMDSDGISDEPVKVKLTVTIAGSDIYLDLAGSARRPAAASIPASPRRCRPPGSRSSSWSTRNVSATGGTFRCLHVSAPEGSIFAAQGAGRLPVLLPACGADDRPVHHAAGRSHAGARERPRSAPTR